MGLGLGWLLYNTVPVSDFLSLRLARPHPLSIPHFPAAKEADSGKPINNRYRIVDGKGQLEGKGDSECDVELHCTGFARTL
jgi:hypothetical protein